jgi:uncharacterized protein (TIGR00106 family)
LLFELSIIPLGGDTHLSDQFAEILTLIEESGLPYVLGPVSTCIEGSWDDVMPVVRACHERARKASTHVITMLKIEDDEGQRDKIRENFESVEAKAGTGLKARRVGVGLSASGLPVSPIGGTSRPAGAITVIKNGSPSRAPRLPTAVARSAWKSPLRRITQAD